MFAHALALSHHSLQASTPLPPADSCGPKSGDFGYSSGDFGNNRSLATWATSSVIDR
jgi:hypothetical protein